MGHGKGKEQKATERGTTMRSTFSGLNISVLGMQSQRKATDITAHNVANASTEGFSRQRPAIVATPPMSYSGAGQVGTGAIVENIERIRDGFLDKQLRDEKELLGYWDARKEGLDKIEKLFMEPGDTGFNTVMGRFFDAWQDLSKNAESSPVRTQLMEISQTLINNVNHLNGQLDDLGRDTNDMIRIQADDINGISEQIAQLNQQIVRVTSRGDSANDLMDRRDVLLDELSDIIDCKVVHGKNGAANILFRGRDLVRENSYNEIKTVYDENNDVNLFWDMKGILEEINIERKDSLASSRDTLEGLYSVRDEVTWYEDQFEILVDSLVNVVNQQHREGYNLEGETDVDFFTWDERLDQWKVSQDIVDDVSRISAAYYEDGLEEGEEVGIANGENALNIAQIRDQRLLRVYNEVDEDGRLKVDEDGNFIEIDEDDIKDFEGDYKLRYRMPGEDEIGQTSLENFYRDSVSTLGAKSQESIRMVENQSALVTQLENRRESISGVSLDEEMSNLIRFQHAYQAGARIINTIDAMLDTIINRMGA